MTPHVASCAEAVQHDDRWTMPADAYVDLGAVGFDLTRLHTDREGVDAILMSVVVHRITLGLKGTWMGSPRGSDGFTTAEGWTFMIRIDWSASPGLGKIEIGQVQTRVSVRDDIDHCLLCSGCPNASNPAARHSIPVDFQHLPPYGSHAPSDARDGSARHFSRYSCYP